MYSITMARVSSAGESIDKHRSDVDLCHSWISFELLTVLEGCDNADNCGVCNLAQDLDLGESIGLL